MRVQLTLVIYPSNLDVKRGGAVGVDARPRSFKGLTASVKEMEVVDCFRSLFSHPLPALFGKPGVLDRFQVADVQVAIASADQSQAESEASIISLGSPAYNAMSGFIEMELGSPAKFRMVEGSLLPVRGLPNDEKGAAALVQDDSDLPEVAAGLASGTRITCSLVERDRKRCVFYAAGLAEVGTAGAAYFLAARWKKLYSRYGARDSFLIVL